MSFFAELRRRNVIRMAGLYVVGAWLVVQVGETLLPIFETPPWVLKTLVTLLVIGFVPTLVFSWLYELTPEGLQRDRGRDTINPQSVETAKRLDQMTLLALVAVVALVAADRYWPRAEAERVATKAEVGPESTLVPSESAEGKAPATKVDSDPASDPSSDAKSIAVLPFVNMSADPDQVYFSDGIAEELLNALVKLPDLKVAGRTSSFAYRDKTGDLREIGRALNVNHILEGSVRKQGARIRITAQLVTAEDGFHLWSETYDREAGDIFALQDEITAEIVQALKVQLGGESVVGVAPIDLDAYDLYLKARQQLALRGVAALQSARELFGRVIDREPGYAPAHAGLARTVSLLWTYASNEANPDSVITRLEAQRTAGLAARRALQLDPDQAEAWSVLGYVACLLGNDLQLAERATTRSLELRPRDPEIVNFAGDFYTWVLDPRAEPTERLAAALDPLQAANQHDLARLMVILGRYDEALEPAETARQLGFYRRSPSSMSDTIIPALLGTGRPDDAEAAIRAAVESDGLGPAMADYFMVGVALARHDPTTASALIDGVIAADPATRPPDNYIADALIRLGRYGEAVDWIKHSVAAQLAWTVDPLYLPLPELFPQDADLLAAIDRPEFQQLFALRRHHLAAAGQQLPRKDAP